MKFVFALYKTLISPFIHGNGMGCRYSPTCSEYAQDAVEKHGFVKGSYLATKRIIRCNPFGSHGYDPVPHKNEK